MSEWASTGLQDICGLDFGTSNSEIGIIQNERSVLVDVENGQKKIPSTIFFDQETRDDVFGNDAIERFLAGRHGRIMWSIKSILGTALMSGSTVIRGRQVAFEEVISRILQNLKWKAERAAGREIKAVMLGRPVHFNDIDMELDGAAERLLRASAAAAGFRDIAFELEPVAAGIEYETHIETESIGIVVDIGGGTSDFSVVRLVPTSQQRHFVDRERILAVGGIHIGGTDFDRQLNVMRVMPELGLGSTYRDLHGQELPMPRWLFHDLASWLRINFIYENRLLDGIYTIIRQNKHSNRKLVRLERVLAGHYGHTIARLVEDAKIRLSTAEAVRLPLGMIESGAELPIKREELNRAVASLLDDTERVLNEVVASAGITHESVDVVFFTGGGSLLPEVRR